MRVVSLSSLSGQRGLSLSAVAAAVLLLSACASTGDGATGNAAAAKPVGTTTAALPAASAASGAGTVPGAAAAARPPAADPTAPKPFADVIKGAKQDDGLFPIWRKDEKVWLEIPKTALNKPFLFTVNIANSVGERGLYASQMGQDWMAEFRRVGNQVQLIALNTKFRAVGEQGSKRAIEQAFSPSLIGASAVASAEHPERKSVLIDAGFLLSDIPGYSTRLEFAYRLPYSVDRSNSSIESARAEAELSTLTARIHFATPRIPAPPLVPPPSPDADAAAGHARSAQPLRQLRLQLRGPARNADGGAPHRPAPRSFLRIVHRSRRRQQAESARALREPLAPGEEGPGSSLSEPVKPITFWMDKNIPVKYRPAVEAGIVEWNKAFEKIGFKNAVRGQAAADDADWDNMDAGHASIRWFVGADVGFAIGPSHTDPRSGEILDADIGMSDVFARGGRAFISEDVGMSSEQRQAQMQHRHPWWPGPRGEAFCNYAHDAAAEMRLRPGPAGSARRHRPRQSRGRCLRQCPHQGRDHA